MQIHAWSVKIRLAPPVEVLEGLALKPQPRTAKAGAIIEVIAAATFVEGHIIGIDHATDLERGRARRVGKGRHDAIGGEALVHLGRHRFHAAIGGVERSFKLHIACFERPYLELPRIEAIVDGVTCWRRGHGWSRESVEYGKRVSGRVNLGGRR